MEPSQRARRREAAQLVRRIRRHTRGFGPWHPDYWNRSPDLVLRRLHRIRWWYRCVTAFALLCVLSLVAILTVGWWLPIPEQFRASDAVVVLGGGTNTQRISHGRDLYKHGYAPAIWWTGNPHDQLSLRRTEFLLTNHYPLGVIVPLDSNSTFADAERIAEQARLRDVQRVIIVTDWFHGRRALASARHTLANSGVELYYSPTPDHPCTQRNWFWSPRRCWAVALEPPKFIYYWLWYGVAPW